MGNAVELSDSACPSVIRESLVFSILSSYWFGSGVGSVWFDTFQEFAEQSNQLLHELESLGGHNKFQKPFFQNP